MKKIINFFNSLGGKIVNFFGGLKSLIFRKAETEKRQKKIALAMAAILVLAVVLVLGWWIWNKFFGPADQNDYIATAKVQIITSSKCGKDCWDVNLFLDALKQKGVKIERQPIAYVSSWLPFASGNALVKKYQITKVPTVVVELVGKDAPDVNAFFNTSLGTVIDNKFVLGKILAPYYDLTDKKLKGLVKVTYLSDKTCAECYDVAKHEIALKNLGISVKGEKIDVDSAKGKELIAKYNITKVPTVLISGEVSEYQVFAQAWADVGIVTDDGTYIFTNVNLMGDSYKDLKTGQVIKSTVAATPAATAETISPTTKK
jgi:hypothetical protein